MTLDDVHIEAENTASAKRAALLTSLDRTIKAEARSQLPPDANAADWLHGSTGYTDPDEHGWMAPMLPEVWMPNVLCHWYGLVNFCGPIKQTDISLPHFSLARWPALEYALQAYLATATYDPVSEAYYPLD